jgi:hypothetical protein
VAELLTTGGFPTKEKDLKNTRRMLGPLPENSIPVDAPGVEKLIKLLTKIWPSYEWWRLVAADHSEPVEDLAAA